MRSMALKTSSKRSARGYVDVEKKLLVMACILVTNNHSLIA